MTEHELLRELLKVYSYDPCTGLFTRILKTHHQNNVGDIVGFNAKPNRYVVIRINKKNYNAHRVAWLLMTGEWPKDQIDHINRKRNDNRFTNLRECTPMQNSRNAVTGANNRSGYKSVHWRATPRKWLASITFKGKLIDLGLFECRHEAARAYNKKAKELDSEYYYLNEVPS